MMNWFLWCRWHGGRDGGHDESGEWRACNPPSWSYSSVVYQGLQVRVMAPWRGRRARPLLQVAYDLGGRRWVYNDRCDNAASGLRRAESIFERLMAEAWRTAWDRRCTFWKWNPTAAMWEPVLSSPSSSWDMVTDYGVYAIEKPGESPWYFEHRWGVSTGGRPEGIPRLPSDDGQKAA